MLQRVFRKALEFRARNDVGVMVFATRVAGSDAGELRRISKQHIPAMATTMPKSSADAYPMINPIIGAQIFRFAPTQVRAGAMRLTVLAAIHGCSCAVRSRYPRRWRASRWWPALSRASAVDVCDGYGYG